VLSTACSPLEADAPDDERERPGDGEHRHGGEHECERTVAEATPAVAARPRAGAPSPRETTDDRAPLFVTTGLVATLKR